MDAPLLVILCSLLLVGAEDCPTGQYTKSGECCKACGSGEGVAQECGVNQTVCEPCLDSVTYSDTTSHTEACKPCTECDGNKRMIAPCVETDDALCACAYGFYKSEDSGECLHCKTCPVGYGMILPCYMNQNTMCEKCPDWTFSNVDNNMDPCLPCTICEDEEITVKECTTTLDTVCFDPNPRIASVTPFTLSADTTVQDSTIMDIETVNPSTEGTEPITPSGAAENLIPVYCSILAAVIAGLVAFIVFKRWNSCKQNKQGGNSHPVNQTPSPEGEKLHSDSGISVNSDSTAEQTTGHTQDTLENF
ncbi:tumor necrosis factor receptor superfamily member 16 isoform X2 [Ranitomeya variabilis]|uniref:tumor necrosis factor receptor superfamily member 16 isoform X2 n=1 Tax=Ranitomeya variabilis TaxID=490064 RepID=UPI004055E8F5